MDVFKLEAQPRTAGKKGARAARRAELVPCVLYGHNEEPVTFQVPVLDMRPLVFTNERHRVQLTVEGKAWDCILKEVVFDPLTDVPMHADFQMLKKGEKITLTVPLRLHGTPVGQIEGGDTQVILHELTVTCLPKDLPEHIDIDVAHLKVGDAIHVGDLALENLKIEAQPQQTIVTVVAPRGVAAEEEEEPVGLLADEEEEDEADAEEQA